MVVNFMPRKTGCNWASGRVLCQIATHAFSAGTSLSLFLSFIFKLHRMDMLGRNQPNVYHLFGREHYANVRT